MEYMFTGYDLLTSAKSQRPNNNLADRIYIF